MFRFSFCCNIIENYKRITPVRWVWRDDQTNRRILRLNEINMILWPTIMLYCDLQATNAFQVYNISY